MLVSNRLKSPERIESVDKLNDLNSLYISTRNAILRFEFPNELDRIDSFYIRDKEYRKYFFDGEGNYLETQDIAETFIDKPKAVKIYGETICDLKNLIKNNGISESDRVFGKSNLISILKILKAL